MHVILGFVYSYSVSHEHTFCPALAKHSLKVFMFNWVYFGIPDKDWQKQILAGNL